MQTLMLLLLVVAGGMVVLMSAGDSHRSSVPLVIDEAGVRSLWHRQLHVGLWCGQSVNSKR